MIPQVQGKYYTFEKKKKKILLMPRLSQSDDISSGLLPYMIKYTS